MKTNLAKIVAVAVVAAAAFLVLVQPWKAHRYDDSPAGVDARRLDARINAAVEARDTWDALTFLGESAAGDID